MSERRCFPFGQPVPPRPPSATGPRTVFVLGAYPSGFHVAWRLPGHEDRRTRDAKALIVDNEPEVFWDGDGAADLFEQWRRDVRFADYPWGRVALPEAGNNSSDRPVCVPSRGGRLHSSVVARGKHRVR